MFLFWGKAEQGSSNYHPAVCHMLDVGIVARELAATLPPQLQERLSALFGTAGKDGLAFFAALHDVGKISPGFQLKREDFCEPLRKEGYDFSKYAQPKHGIVAAWCLPGILEEILDCPEETASVLAQVLAAHHGTFVGYDQVIAGGDKWDKARQDAVRFLAEVFQADSLEAIPTPSTADALMFAGLLTMADWLGSSEKHFPFAGATPVNIPDYVSDRKKRAKALVEGLRMDSFVMAEKPFDELFPFSPNPCQQAVLKVVSRLQHPMLIVVESPTGTGKTEAAQAAFSLLTARHSLRGMYYALPTQATGNAMFPRMKSFLEKLDLSGQAELHLLHANADLNQDYENLQIKHVEEGDGSVVASSWFTARKRGILANYGAGTVDQALMAVLKVRHFFLRLFGLSGKLLVLDEVHAYDAYMTEEISRLIGWLAHLDSSVVLLSATLPQNRRQKLVEAFAPDADVPPALQYPCVLAVDASGQTACEQIKGLQASTVALAPVICTQSEKAEKVIRLLAEKLVEGGCAACILNTVAEAQAIYAAVKEQIGDADIVLFHSRFTLEQKLEIEEKVLSRYGKNRPRPRKGIVVATQVVEQSLDLDFDFMVSDLAPIDLLLQRAGRLHRHDNHRPTPLRERVLHVLLPDILGAAPDFGGSAYVYFPDILSKTALLFTAQGEYQTQTVALPYGVSPLVEAVYGNEDPLVAGHLQKSLDKWIEERMGKEFADLYLAREASLPDARLCVDDPDYLSMLSNDDDDERMLSTRLARPSVTLVLLEKGEGLTVRGQQDARRLYGRSLVTDKVHLVRHFQSQETPGEWKEVALLRHCHPLVLRDGKTAVEGQLVSYDNDYGLRIERKKEGV